MLKVRWFKLGQRHILRSVKAENGKRTHTVYAIIRPERVDLYSWVGEIVIGEPKEFTGHDLDAMKVAIREHCNVAG